jgi:hypothetical protein
MKAIPTDSYFYVDTDLEKSDVEKRLRENVRARSLHNFFALPLSSLIGEVYWSGFEVKKEVWYNFGASPVCRGSFEKRGRGVRVKVNAFSLYATLRTIGFWIISLITLVAAFVNLFRGDYHSARFFALFAIIMGFGAYISVRGYYRSIHDVHEELLALLSTKIDGKVDHP